MKIINSIYKQFLKPNFYEKFLLFNKVNNYLYPDN